MDFNTLNAPQRQAVEQVDGPLLVLAGAGSGKTRVLTYRVAHLIRDYHVRPWNILALTFTNKAAREMRERIEVLLEDSVNVQDMWVMTFHSCCARILRRDAKHIGYDTNFVIYDDADQLTLYTDIIKRLELDDKRFAKRLLRERISHAKNHSTNPEEYLRDEAFASVYLDVYRMYQRRLRENNALDFDDLLLKVIELFEKCPEVLEYYQEKFQYILVDEYQDTNMAQYHLVQLLGREHRNVCVVGDDDQSIYGWRGADIRNILEFEKDFPGAKIVRLEQNYRSTSIILEAANAVIDNNRGRKRKTLWTERAGGEQIQLYCAMNERMEAEYLCCHILEGVRRGRRHDDFAVLYRTNAQSRVLETVLTSYGIPYRVYGGQRFYERAEIKDLLAYLRLLYNPADDVAFLRVINVPRRGIGAAAVEEVSREAQKQNMPMFLVAMQGDGLSPRVFQKTKVFTDQMADLLALRESATLETLMEELMQRIGYDAYLRDDKKENYETRRENISELVGAMREFEEGLPPETDALGAYLENVSLVADIDNLDEKNGQVALMTLHSAKGLEFPVVFIVGVEENIFPGRRARMEPADMEEERRLCYVGITRAMEQLHIVHAQQRMLYGEMQANLPSRFIEEIPFALVNDVSGATKEARRTPENRETGYAPGGIHGGFGRPAPDVQRPSNEEKAQEFRLHQRVRHAKFGEGTVQNIEGRGSAQVVTIDFGATQKRFAANLAPLTVIDE
ncbi:DNA helicase PcrA [Christensenellaceae bacterium OttesenSCG-928-L17]|nr:DNA helicase PcrA [Christensenellaceae bacterium OttesenSCG-928-L17]